jgi:hypothetical protein
LSAVSAKVTVVGKTPQQPSLDSDKWVAAPACIAAHTFWRASATLSRRTKMWPMLCCTERVWAGRSRSAPSMCATGAGGRLLPTHAVPRSVWVQDPQPHLLQACELRSEGSSVRLTRWNDGGVGPAIVPCRLRPQQLSCGASSDCRWLTSRTRRLSSWAVQLAEASRHPPHCPAGCPCSAPLRRR